VPDKTNDLAGPRHIAIIMDGNGRWARQRSLPRQAGHRAGVKPVRQVVEQCAQLGVEVLTLFAFSSENWQRPAEEVRGLMSLFVEALDREVEELDRNGIRLKFIGDLDSLNPVLLERIRAAEFKTLQNTRMTLVIAVAYGGRWDLAQAAQRMAAEVADGKLQLGEINSQRLSSYLALAGLPELDLLIRSGGEQRVSNFLLWEIAYAEIFFTDVLWPDFGADELARAMDFFGGRQRRFGQTSEQVEAASC
jgi:undecaprenyl diphosphate synthase